MLVSPRGSVLPPVTQEDLLWLARAVEAEGPPRALVAQTLVNRWAWLHDTHPGAYPRLKDLVRAYASPVNPRWFPGGDLLAKAIADDPAYAAELERAASQRPVHAQRTKFSADTTAAVQAALYGPLSLPAGTVHYSAPKRTAAAQARWAPLTVSPGVPGRSNSLFTERGAQGVLYQITSAGPTWAPAAALSVGRPSAALGVALLGLVLGFAAAKKMRRGR